MSLPSDGASCGALTPLQPGGAQSQSSLPYSFISQAWGPPLPGSFRCHKAASAPGPCVAQTPAKTSSISPSAMGRDWLFRGLPMGQSRNGTPCSGAGGLRLAAQLLQSRTEVGGGFSPFPGTRFSAAANGEESICLPLWCLNWPRLRKKIPRMLCNLASLEITCH